MLINAIQSPDDFRHVVEISQSCYAVYHRASQGPSNPTGYCRAEERWTFPLHEQELLKKKWFSSFCIRVLLNITDEHG